MNTKTRELMMEHNHKSARTDAQMEILLDYAERIYLRFEGLQPSLQRALSEITLGTLAECIETVQKRADRDKLLQKEVDRNIKLEELKT